MHIMFIIYSIKSSSYLASECESFRPNSTKFIASLWDIVTATIAYCAAGYTEWTLEKVHQATIVESQVAHFMQIPGLIAHFLLVKYVKLNFHSSF
jgi:hypothetical protein